VTVAQQLQSLNEATPAWVNWLVIVGGAAASWLAPLASLVAIIWGCLQIYGWIEKRRKP
jgi:hypothetical protein